MGTRATKWLLLVSSVATLLLLATAAYQEHERQEWRQLQREYRAALAADKAAAFRVQLRQIVVPALKASDRCVSCHLGMVPGEDGIRGHPVFSPHPAVVHDPAEFGCVACHGGQGRATRAADAHGDIDFWPAPMIPRRFAYAGCGSCHTHLTVPGRRALETGRDLFERHDCLACHRMDGRGGTLRPGGAGGREGSDLSRAGITGYDAEWYPKHLQRRAEGRDRVWLAAFGEIPPADRDAIDVYLGSRVGAPGLVESKAVFTSLGCRGCHQVGGVGGNDGPDLTRVGERDPGRLNFAGVRGKHDLATYFAEHFRAPARVVPGSLMPELGLGEADIDALTFCMFSLRRSAVPEAYWPRDRIRAERFGARELASDGETLYGAFCAACHGPRGEGMRYPGMSAFPAIANPDFLAIADDGFLLATIRRGRPGRRMPAWGAGAGALGEDDMRRIVAYLREGPGGGVAAEVNLAPPAPGGDPAEGARLYAAACAGCHGARRQGAEGPMLANPVLLESASDAYLAETIRRGRRGTSMPAFAAASKTFRALTEPEIASLVRYLRTPVEEKP